MIRRRESGLRTCKVEADENVVVEVDGRPGHQFRVVVLAKGVYQHVCHRPRLRGATAHPCRRRRQHVTAVHAAAQVQGRSEAQLAVDDTVGCQVDDGLIGDSLNGRWSLHHRHRVCKRLQIGLQRRRIFLEEPCRQRFCIPRREVLIPCRFGQFENSLHPQPAVQVIV